MSKSGEDTFYLGPPLPDGIWELTPRPGDTLDELNISIVKLSPNAPSGAKKSVAEGFLPRKRWSLFSSARRWWSARRTKSGG